MCGIAGLVNWGGAEEIGRMNAVQAHRGPDDSGCWTRSLPNGDRYALGSQRLAILDLSRAGHMPMTNEDGTLWIAYNGEIYNYRQLRAELIAKGHTFRSNADTEAVLHLYEEEGPECVQKLNGMFAFALVDLRHEHPRLFTGARPFRHQAPLLRPAGPEAGRRLGSQRRCLSCPGLIRKSISKLWASTSPSSGFRTRAHCSRMCSNCPPAITQSSRRGAWRSASTGI